MRFRSSCSVHRMKQLSTVLMRTGSTTTSTAVHTTEKKWHGCSSICNTYFNSTTVTSLPTTIYFVIPTIYIHSCLDAVLSFLSFFK
jgi:hypothetical protein